MLAFSIGTTRDNGILVMTPGSIAQKRPSTSQAMSLLLREARSVGLIAINVDSGSPEHVGDV